MKKILFLLVLLLCFSFKQNIYAAEKEVYKNDKGEVYLTVDNLPVNIKNDSILYVNDKVMELYPILDEETNYSLIPLRVVSNELNKRVSWDNSNRVVEINNNGEKIKFTIGENIATVDGKIKILPVAAKIINDNTYVPTRFVTDFLDCKVEYDDKSIIFTEKEKKDFAIFKNALPKIKISQKQLDEKILFTERELDKYQRLRMISFDEIKRSDGEMLFYSNFPEKILTNAFLETYYNTGDYVGDIKVFNSHVNVSGEKVDFITRIENFGTSNINISAVEDSTIQNEEETHSSYPVGRHLESYYDNVLKNRKTDYTINSGESLDFIIEDIENNRFFTSQIEFFTNESVKITTFAVKSKENKDYSNIKTPEIAYDFDYEPETYVADLKKIKETDKYYTTYSGKGYSNKVNAYSNLKASDLEKNQITFETGATTFNINEKKGLKEVVEIFLVEARGIDNEIEKAEWMMNLPYTNDDRPSNKDRARNYGNLGNWGVDYEMVMTLENDTDEDKTFKLSLVPTYLSTMGVIKNNRLRVIIQNNREIASGIDRITRNGEDTVALAKNLKVWDIYEITVPKGETVTTSYEYFLGTDGNANVYHLWNIK